MLSTPGMNNGLRMWPIKWSLSLRAAITFSVDLIILKLNQKAVNGYLQIVYDVNISTSVTHWHQ